MVITAFAEIAECQGTVLLGIKEHHLLIQRASWDAGNPGVKVVMASAPSRETSLLAKWGGRNVPRYSMEIEFEPAGNQPVAGPGSTA
jgi:hypothetical protein